MSKKKILFTLMILFLMTGIVKGLEPEFIQEIRNQIEPMVDKGEVGIYLKSLTEDQMIYEYNSKTPLIPASNQKIVTTVGAYYLLDPEFKYRTEMYLEEGWVKVGSYFFGNLAIKGYGDPLFHYPTLIKMIQNSPLGEVKNFHGHLYIDDTYFDNVRFGRDWNYEFGKEIGAMIFRDTSLAKPEDDPQLVPKNVGRTVQMIFKGLRMQHKGKLWAGVAMPDDMTLHYAVESVPLLEIIGMGNKQSDNSILEQIFKTISAEKLGQGSAEGTEEVLKEFYQKELDLNPELYQIRDGSGLSRTNLISASYLARMLEYAYYHPSLEKNVDKDTVWQQVLQNEHPFLNTLSIAGVDGTLKKRMIGTQIYGKTGTLNGVDTISGYIITKSQQVVVFSIISNQFTIERNELRAWEDSLLRYIYNNY